jgi:hypothetical protein
VYITVSVMYNIFTWVSYFECKLHITVSVMHIIFTWASYFECKLYIVYVCYILFTLYLRMNCRGVW